VIKIRPPAPDDSDRSDANPEFLHAVSSGNASRERRVDRRAAGADCAYAIFQAELLGHPGDAQAVGLVYATCFAMRRKVCEAARLLSKRFPKEWRLDRMGNVLADKVARRIASATGTQRASP
jgi:hypothetical protein